MTAPTITGALTMISTNGDSAQLLTEAAEFVTALAQIGLTLGVRIELAPVPALNTITHFVADTERVLLPATPRIVAHGPIEFPDDVYPTPPNPTPARAAQPTPRPYDYQNQVAVAPEQWPATLAQLDAGEIQFRQLAPPSRLEWLTTFGRSLTADIGHAPSQAQWDKRKPQWAPSAASLPVAKHPNWPQTWAHWQTRFATSTDTSSGESA